MPFTAETSGYFRYNILLLPKGWLLTPFTHPQRLYGRTGVRSRDYQVSRMDELKKILRYGATRLAPVLVLTYFQILSMGLIPNYS